MLALRTFRRTGSPAVRALADGLGFGILGALLARFLHQFARTDLTTVIAVQSTATAVGVSVIAYSLYAEGPAGTVESNRGTVGEKPPDYST